MKKGPGGQAREDKQCEDPPLFVALFVRDRKCMVNPTLALVVLWANNVWELRMSSKECR